MRAAYATSPYAEVLAADAGWAHTEGDSAGRDRDGRVLVAEHGGRLLGAVSVLRGGTEHSKLAGDGEAELRLVVVRPEGRGRGLGEALVRAGVEEALGWGARTVRLDTGVQNPAQRLYERLGFVRTPERDQELSGASYGESLSYEYPLREDAGVHIRLARQAEYDAVGELVLAAYRDDYPMLDAEYLAEIADVAGRAATGLVWVAEDAESGRLLGTVTTPVPGELLTTVGRPGEMDIRLLGVDRAARGRGIGALLTRHGVRLARIRGAHRLSLETSTEMGPAWRLYERLGFERLPDRERIITRDDGTIVPLLAYGLLIADIDPAESQFTGRIQEHA